MDETVLCFDILLDIAYITNTPKQWYKLVTSIPSIGIYSIRMVLQKRLKNRWTVKHKYVDYKVFKGIMRDTRIVNNHDVKVEIIEYKLPNGMLYRENDLPAKTTFFPSGKKMCEIWFTSFSGKKHRENDKPAEISYYPSGRIDSKVWYKEGKETRENELPSVIIYYPPGKIQYKKWNREGACPIIIKYNHRKKK